MVDIFIDTDSDKETGDATVGTYGKASMPRHKYNAIECKAHLTESQSHCQYKPQLQNRVMNQDLRDSALPW